MLRSAAVLCLVVAACSGLPSERLRLQRPRLDGRIVGGEPVDISQYPWQVSLQLYDAHNCGGSVISETWVLTAAHCLEGHDASSLSVRAGTSTRNTGGDVHGVASVLIHDSHETGGKDYDVGVVAISGSFSFGSNVQVVNLGSVEPAAGTAVTITGWGALSSGGPSPTQLQAVTTSVVDRETCSENYYGVTERMICAGEEDGGKDSCQGDSGGPLVEGSTQYGVVSWGQGCAYAGYPGVYANVAVLRPWISRVTGI